MSDPGFNSKYQKYKYRVKSWERKFHDKFKRIPSKVMMFERSPKNVHVVIFLLFSARY